MQRIQSQNCIGQKPTHPSLPNIQILPKTWNTEYIINPQQHHRRTLCYTLDAENRQIMSINRIHINTTLDTHSQSMEHAKLHSNIRQIPIRFPSNSLSAQETRYGGLKPMGKH